MIEETLKERGDNYGNFHTQANLTQTLITIITQHHNSVHADEDGKVTPLPHFMLESIHMICHKLARIANGNPYYADSWHDIGGYSQLVVQILESQLAQVNEAQEQEQKQGQEPINDLQTEGTEDA
jgi:hypothetical protein